MYFLFPTLVPELCQQCPSHSRRHLTASLRALQCSTNMSVPLSEWWKQKQTETELAEQKVTVDGWSVQNMDFK